MLGELADDTLLHDVLKEVLGQYFGRLSAATSMARPSSIDPTFAASRGLATDCWDRMSYQEFDIRGYEL